MADVVFVLLLIALFALTAGFIAVCDRMLGSDEEAMGDAAAIAEEPQRLAA